MAPYAATGGSLALSYQLIVDFLNHHETNKDRPKVIDHFVATTILGTVIGTIMGGRPRYTFVGFLVSATLFAPMSWWVYKHARINAQSRPSNIFYENSVTQEELERIQQLDMIENLGAQMQSKPGYGYYHGDQRHV